MTRVFTQDEVSAIVRKRLDQARTPRALADALLAIVDRCDQLEERIRELEGRKQ